jgi:hypothetical protein
MEVMGVGSLVVPVVGEEYLFVDEDYWDDEEKGSWFEPIEVVWEGVYGVVLVVEEFVPSREYQRVRVLVGEVVGWTYSDYLEVVVYE